MGRSCSLASLPSNTTIHPTSDCYELARGEACSNFEQSTQTLEMRTARAEGSVGCSGASRGTASHSECDTETCVWLHAK
eukprot:1421481-Rhodomonas_salina.1